MRLLRPLPLAALVLTALLAGCAGGPGETITARGGLSDAEDAARDWAEGEDLHLLGIVAVEPFQRINWTDGDEESGEFVTHLDGNPGDGRAPAWAYGFLAGDRCIAVVLAAGLGVLAEGYATCEGDDTVGDWEFDSDDVAGLLRERDDWPDLGPDGTYFWELVAADGDALWSVAGQGQDGESAHALVNAETGEVLDVDTGIEDDFFFGGPVSSGEPGTSGTDEDQDAAVTLTAGQSLTAELDLEGVGAILVDLSARSTMAGLTLRIEGPSGVIEETEVGGLVGNEYQEQRAYSGLAPGHYTVTLTAEGVTLFPSLLAMGYW